MIWFVLYQWSCFATKNMYSYTFTGAAALILLFQGSTWLTELITAGKYTEYPKYQEQVGMFLPKSFTPYKTPGSKVIRTSDIAKKMESKKQA
jgi:steroid 5-alpha reductase family enzyme